MDEALFEERLAAAGEIQYPFSCFICDNESKNFAISPHWHYYIEVLYFLSGAARIFLGGQCYNTKAGDLVLINGREVHSIYADEGNSTRYIVIKFDPEVLYTTTRTVFEAKYILPFTMAKSSHQEVFLNNELVGTVIPSLVQEIYDEYKSKNYGFELAVRTGICRLFLWVLRNWQSKGLNFEADYLPKENDIRKLQALFDYLDKHYSEDISTRDMSKMCGMSYSYFSRQFKKMMRKTFTEYLNYIRITEAEKLLLTTDLNITQVALNTGFTNSSYFIKQFKHFKKVSPKHFKRKASDN